MQTLAVHPCYIPTEGNGWGGWARQEAVEQDEEDSGEETDPSDNDDSGEGTVAPSAAPMGRRADAYRPAPR